MNLRWSVYMQPASDLEDQPSSSTHFFRFLYNNDSIWTYFYYLEEKKVVLFIERSYFQNAFNIVKAKQNENTWGCLQECGVSLTIGLGTYSQLAAPVRLYF